MKALILAAGIGSRLGNLTRDIPKCLLRIGDTTIIDYQIRLLTEIAKLELRDIYVVAGHRAEKLNYLRKLGVTIIFNSRYKKFNNIYSFYLAKNFISEDFILLNGDTLIHRGILKNLVKSRYQTAFVIDNIKSLGWEEMKVIIKEDRIVRFGKDIPPEIADGEYIGAAKISIRDAQIIFKYIESLLREGKTNIWYEDAINYTLDKIEAYAVYTDGLPWIEIDTPEDYRRAKEMFRKIVAMKPN